MQAPLLSQIRRRSRRASQKWLMCMDSRRNGEWMIKSWRGDGQKVFTFGNRLQETDRNLAEYLPCFFFFSTLITINWGNWCFFFFCSQDQAACCWKYTLHAGQLQSDGGREKKVQYFPLNYLGRYQTESFTSAEWQLYLSASANIQGGGCHQWQRGRMASFLLRHPLLFKEET